MSETRKSISDDELIHAFTSRGYAPEECWICYDTSIRPIRGGSGGRPLFTTDRERELDRACVDYLRRIGRPDVQLKEWTEEDEDKLRRECPIEGW